MAISDRIEATLLKWSDQWKDRLKGWLKSAIGLGIEAFMDVLSKSMAPKLKPLMDKLESTGEVPPELQPMIDEIKNPSGESAAMFGLSASQPLVGGAIGRIADAALAPLAFAVARLTRNAVLNPDQVITAEMRGLIDPAWAQLTMESHAFEDQDIKTLRELYKVILPSEVVGPVYLRDKAKFAKFWNELPKLGLSKEQIEVLEEALYRIPGVQDIIRYVVKEAYNEEIYKAFGQDQEYPAIAEADAIKAGVRPDMLRKEWISHWDLPSVGNGFEMLHRRLITANQLELLLKARDIMPFWRDKLTAMSWSLPTRIEVRMMAQLGLVDKPFIMKILEADGLAEEYRSTVADMNIVRGIRTDLQTRYTKKWINSDEVRAEIQRSGLSPEIGERLYQWIVTNVKPERTTIEKDLTAAEIIKGVKKGVITWDDGIARLIALGYDEEEATFKLAIDIEVVEEEPTSELTVRVDTIRRQRRQRLLSRDQEISELLNLGLDYGLAMAYADNDDMRLVKEVAPKPPEIIPEYLTDDGKVKVETIRLSRRQRKISRYQEITSLVDLEMSSELAVAYADNDDLRLIKETTGGA
jgi:hypothetical protein